MSQKVQELIDKIKSEGIESAESKAREIKEGALNDAKGTKSQAEVNATKIITEAKEEAKKIHEATEKALQQAARDTLLSLRQSIQGVLKSVVKDDVSSTLNSDGLAGILTDVIKNNLEGSDQKGLDVFLNPDTLNKLKDSSLAKLGEQLKKSVQLQSSNDVGSGFMISYDGGKSSYDFTDDSLAEYLSSYLNSHVAQIVKDAVK